MTTPGTRRIRPRPAAVDDSTAGPAPHTPAADEESTGYKVGGGFAAWKKKKDKFSKFAKRIKLTDDPTLVKFLEPEPFAVWAQHWVGKTPYTCIEQGCPLCDAGNQARLRAAFNVVNMNTELPEPQVLEAGSMLLEVFEKKSEKGPLTSEYWAISQTGQRMRVNYLMEMVRARDLDEEWDSTGLSEDDLADANKRKVDAATYVRVRPKSELRDIARSLGDDDEES